MYKALSQRPTSGLEKAMRSSGLLGRRQLLGAGLLAAAGGLFSPASIAGAEARPRLTHGLQSGEVSQSSGVIWGRSDRASRLIAELSHVESFRDSRRISGPVAHEGSDFTAQLRLESLPPDQEVFYRLRFQDLQDPKLVSEPAMGRFRTAPARRRRISFLWSADMCGQGWGINPDWGGMKIFETMRRLEPDFFVHCGDRIYADDPPPAEKALPDGGVWRNLVLPEIAKVAESLAEFRAHYKYNLLDHNFLRFAAEVPILATWSDHEVVNNWYPGERLDLEQYEVRSVDRLAAYGRRAFEDYTPRAADVAQPLYRVIHYGPQLDLFLLDMRSHRSVNSGNRQNALGPDSRAFGARQMAWLKQALAASRATWKVIAAEMPIGVKVHDPGGRFDGIANGKGAPLGRELEIADLLSFIARNGVANCLWLTGDVHYTAAHHYHPDRARFRDFLPFWEFVSGPLNAETRHPHKLDDSFGPERIFAKGADRERSYLPPSVGRQFFGEVVIDGESDVMTVRLRDLAGEVLYAVDIEPQR